LSPVVDGDLIKVGEMSLEEAFVEYISHEDNKALLKSKLSPGSGVNIGSSQNKGNGNGKFNPEDLKGKSIDEINSYFKEHGIE
jgi:hypothetical protein